MPLSLKIYKTGFHVKVFARKNFYVKSYFVTIPNVLIEEGEALARQMIEEGDELARQKKIKDAAVVKFKEAQEVDSY